MSETKIIKKPEKVELTKPVHQIHIPDEDKYGEILKDMMSAFYEKRKGCESRQSTEKYCRGVLDTCLTGFHRTGKAWLNPPGKDATDWFKALQLRLAVYKYDLVKKEMIPSGRGQTSERIKQNATMPKKDAGLLSPGITTKTLSPSEQEEFDRFVHEFTEAFPESVTVVDEMMIRRLAFFMVLSNRDITYVDVSKDLTKEIQMLVEALGVSGKQRNNLMNKDRDGTLELLTTKYKKTRDEHIEIEQNYMLEELKLISAQVRRDTVPEFLAMYWIKILYGKKIGEEELSMAAVDRFLRENGIDV